MHVKPYFFLFPARAEGRASVRRETDDGGGEGGEGLSVCEAGEVGKRYLNVLNSEEGEVMQRKSSSANIEIDLGNPNLCCVNTTVLTLHPNASLTLHTRYPKAAYTSKNVE